MDEKDFVAPKSHLHDVYITSSPMKEWHNIDSYVCKLLENNPGLTEYDCFAICCRSLSSLSTQVLTWPGSVSKYASVLLSKWKGSEKQHWLDLAKKAIQRKRDDEKIIVNSAEIRQKEIIQQQRTTVSAINFVTEEIDGLASRKRQREQELQSDDYSEEKVSKKQTQEGSISPSPNSQVSVSLLEENNPFFDEEDEEDEEEEIVIDDVPSEFSFENGDPENGIYMGETNVSLLFRNYQDTSLDLAKKRGLFVESNVQEILSLSSILLLASDSYSDIMIDHFGLSLLDEIRKNFTPVQQISLDSNSEATFRKAVKMAMNGSRDEAINKLCGELSNEKSLRDNLGFVVLDCLRTLPSSKIRNEHSEITHYTNFLDRIMKGLFDDPDKHVVHWPNTALNESKTRKIEGRAKQPDFTVSIVYQLQTSDTIFVGEVSPPSKRGDVYKNCNDLVRLGVFMKDMLDSSIDKGADIKVLGFQCVDYKIDYYIMDLVQGIYTMINVGQVLIPASLKDMSSFIDSVELSLGIQDIFRESYKNLYARLCNPGSLIKKATFKQDTLSTPKFRKLVSKTHKVNRPCPFWFGRF